MGHSQSTGLLGSDFKHRVLAQGWACSRLSEVSEEHTDLGGGCLGRRSDGPASDLGRWPWDSHSPSLALEPHLCMAKVDLDHSEV